MVTALGSDVPTVWRRLLAGDNGIAPISYFNASQYACRVAAEVRSLPLEDIRPGCLPLEYCRRGLRAFQHAAREAFSDSCLTATPPPRPRIGVAVGTTVNYVNIRLARRDLAFRRPGTHAMDLARFARECEQPAHTFYRRQGDLAGAATAKALGLGGPTLVSDTACAASSFAIGRALRLIQRGRADAMVAGGACAIVAPPSILAFSVLGALSSNPDPEQASRPFDRRRDGFVMGEGAGAVVVERLDHARNRGARIYGEIVGYGSTMSAHNLTDPSPDGDSEARAMQLALEEGGLGPEEIDYVAAHGTSTAKNDVVETLAIKRVFGRHAQRLMVSSNKGQIGHTVSAAGVCNLICALKAINDGWVPPTAHLHEPDPECDLDYVPNIARRATVRGALVNAFAFGGQNAVLAVRGYERRAN
jgi:3-oxoacyl-(acyl-carrier-protein) synthase